MLDATAGLTGGAREDCIVGTSAHIARGASTVALSALPDRGVPEAFYRSAESSTEALRNTHIVSTKRAM